MRWYRFGFLIQFVFILFAVFSCSKSGDDINACNGSLQIKIIEINDAVDGQPKGGGIIADASGGKPPYLFSVDGVNFTESKIFTDLDFGTYTIAVKDQNECTDEMNVDVKLQAIVSYSKNIVPILQTNCMISGCHCDGNSLCFDNYENVKANSRGIRDRTAQRAMPPASSGKVLTDNEITEITNWVYQGALNN